MSTIVGDRLLAGDHEIELARQTLEELGGPAGYLAVGESPSGFRPLPREIGVLLQGVLRALAAGSSVTVMATPREVTTSTAAAMLGVSRPTLMKMIRDGVIASHKVGTHTRLASADVLDAKRARRARERAAFAALMEAEGDE